ncbi:hypothetical protein SDC9_190789 [bioreactor metagenome]|uniref:Uncharacterized protein n=1 Tax=bioreactor metagenome TaxID=1076179 RepID=A0A645HWJ5_9ZZZZ
MRAQCEHPQRHLADCLGVADAAVDKYARPAVLHRQLGQLITHQRATHRSAAVDDQHPAIAGGFEGLAHQRVVLEQLQRTDRATESGDATKTGKHWRNDLDGVFMGITQVGCLDIHA